MAWSAPPTFSATTLSAAQLNILSDDVEYLKGVAETTNTGFQRLGGASGVVAKSVFVRYKLAWLNVRMTWDKGGDPGADFALVVKWGGSGGSTIISQSLSGTTPTTAIYSDDVETGESPTEGTWYEVYIDCPTNSYAGTYAYIDIVYQAATDDHT